MTWHRFLRWELLVSIGGVAIFVTGEKIGLFPPPWHALVIVLACLTFLIPWRRTGTPEFMIVFFLGCISGFVLADWALNHPRSEVSAVILTGAGLIVAALLFALFFTGNMTRTAPD